jgi:hypothetical protein
MTVQAEALQGRRWWSVYLNNHLAGATAGVRLTRRLAASADRQSGADIDRLAREVAEDRESLLRIMAQLGVRRVPGYAVAGALAERIGRLKPNGRVLRRSPLTPLAECEAMLLGVQGKLQGWNALLAAAPHPAIRTDLQQLRERATAQLGTLARLHQRLAGDLGGQPRAHADAGR